MIWLFLVQPGAAQAKSDAFRASAKRKMSITSSAATMRVLSVLRHWVTKHGQVLLDSWFRCKCVWQDFEGNPHLKNLSIEFLEDIVCTPTLLPAEHKAASQLLRYFVIIIISLPIYMSIIIAQTFLCPPPHVLILILIVTRMLTKEEPAHNIINLEEILTPSAVIITICHLWSLIIPILDYAFPSWPSIPSVFHIFTLISTVSDHYHYHYLIITAQ